MLGDFNAAGNYLFKKASKKLDIVTLAKFKWLLPDDADTTVGKTKHCYDRSVPH